MIIRVTVEVEEEEMDEQKREVSMVKNSKKSTGFVLNSEHHIEKMRTFLQLLTFKYNVF